VLDQSTLDRCAHLPALPALGNSPPRMCVFLSGSQCTIYAERPMVCREYPLITTETDDHLVVRISADCPLAERICEGVRKSPPAWITARARGRPLRIVVSSFYEREIGSFYGEED
jgi:hypothetical protein